MITRAAVVMFSGKLEFAPFCTAESLYSKMNMKLSLCLISAGPNFYMISNNLNASLRKSDWSLFICRIALQDDYHKLKMQMPACTPVEYNYSESLQNTFISSARKKNKIFQETISAMLYFVELPWRIIQILHFNSVERSVKIHSFNSKPVSGKIEYSEKINQP